MSCKICVAGRSVFCTVIAFGFAVLSSLASQCQGQQAVLKYDVKVDRDILYTEVGGVELKLDLARPILKNSNQDDAESNSFVQSAPCVVVIHGGGWRQGNKSNHLNEIQHFAEAGYVSATIQYRFCPEHRFPAQVQDVMTAVRFLRAHSEQYGIDPRRIGAVGFSAGAHLSMMLGTVESETDLFAKEFRDETERMMNWRDRSSKVQAVVSYFGPTDFMMDNTPDLSRPLMEDFLGGTAEEQPLAYKLASPINHVDESDAPTLLFQGTKDLLVPYDQATRMAEKMSVAGMPGRVEILIGEGHGWGGPQRQYTIAETDEFFAQHLK